MNPPIDTGRALRRELDLLSRVSEEPDLRFLWFWKAPQSLVAPRKLAARPGFDTAARTLTAEGWPVFLRSTGGDVTPQGPGIVNVTHVYATSADIRFDIARAYDALCAPIEAALGPGATRGWQSGAFCDGAHNVQFDGRKFAGTAMRFRPARGDRSRHAVMAHALMLFEPPPEAAITAINRFLEAMGEDREIDRNAHTGLPDRMSGDRFLAALKHHFSDIADLPRLSILD